ncbi:MAG: hypothetical protein ABW277_26185 [Longimicrobiaceae bacterium]
MNHRLILTGLAAAALASCGGEERPRQEGPPLTLAAIDSVELQENDSLYLGAPTHMTVGADGDLYVSDVMNGHVLRFSRDGRPVARYGRRGRGPGEMGGPVATTLMGDSLLVAADWRNGRTSVFDRNTGAFVRSTPLEGYPLWMQVVGDTIWMSDVNITRKTSLAAWPTAQDSVRYLGTLPMEYVKSPILLESHPYATMLRTGDTILLGYTGHRALFLLDPGGAVFDTVEVPAVRRRGVPEDILERFSEPLENDEIASMGSALVALHRLPGGEVAAFYLDVTVDGRLITADGFLSVLSPDFRSACVDIPFEFRRDGRPVVAFRGDTLFTLEQRIVSETRAVSSVRSYRIDTSRCRWLPVGTGGAAASGRGAMAASSAGLPG